MLDSIDVCLNKKEIIEISLWFVVFINGIALLLLRMSQIHYL